MRALRPVSLPVGPSCCLCTGSDLGIVAGERLPVVDHVPRRDADGHDADFGGGAGQRVISHRLAQVFGDAKAEAVGQDPRAWRAHEQLHLNVWSCFVHVGREVDVLLRVKLWIPSWFKDYAG